MQLGPYEVQGEIGRGGMGVVLRARGPDGRDVAIKQLLQGRSAEAQARFERERRLLASLGSDEGFVPLLDAGSSQHGPYIVMPFLEGGTLKQRLRRGPLGVEQTVELGIALARALGRAHASKVVHRDLKPDNVLYSKDGEPLVADLGLAKHFARDNPEAKGSVSISVAGELVGSIGYMAPEQMDDAKHVGPATDVFALGAILYECLTGERAFEADTSHAVLAKVALGEFVAPRKTRPDAPRWLCQIIERCLAHRPQDRFPDGEALARALEAGPGGSGRRGPLVGAAAFLGGLAVFTGIILVVRQTPSDEGEPRPATTSPGTTTPATSTNSASDPGKKPATKEPSIVARIALPDLPAGQYAFQAISVDPELGRAVLGCTAMAQGNQTLVVDLASGQVVRTLEIGGPSIDPKAHLVFGTTCSGRECLAYDLATLDEKWRSSSDQFWGMLTRVDAASGLVYLGCQNGAPRDPILAYDEKTGERRGEPVRPDGIFGRMQVDASSHRLFACYGTRLVIVGPPPDLAILADRAELGVVALDPERRRIIAASSATNRLLLADLDGVVRSEIDAVCTNPLGIVVDPPTGKAYQAEPLPDGLRVFSGEKLETIARMALDPGFAASALCIDAKARKLYAAAYREKERKVFVLSLP